MVAKYDVTVQSPGGGSTKSIRVEATSSDKAKVAAEAIANAEAKANGSSYTYKATSVRDVW